jgi:alkylation response protein AidB-like acyl-CoA dehydrogenase
VNEPRTHRPGYEFLDGLTEEEDTFRGEVADWLRTHLVGEYASARGIGGPADESMWELRKAWEKELARHNLRGMAVPVEYGGRGLSLRMQLIFAFEYAASNAPYRPSSASEDLFAQTLLVYGTEEQKHRFIPDILSSNCYWAQGFSEPDAGSDMASVKTQAYLDGDEWVVEGQKVWTTFAQFCDWIYVLCRTDPEAPKHKGLTILMMPLDQPGIELRPIRTMAGNADFNEVFFSEARTKVDLTLGPVSSGWGVAMTLLSIERGTSLFSYQLMFERELRAVIDSASSVGNAESGELRERLIRSWSELRLLGFFNQRILTTLARDGSVGPESSIGKLLASTWHQRLGNLAVDAAGLNAALVQTDYELPAAQKLFLLSRAETIYGGSQEIQKNLVAERILGLPR